MRLITQWSRVLTVLVALAFVAAVGSAGVLAQDDAENAGPAGQPPLGAAVPFIGEEGNELGTITVTGYADPFEDYDPSSPPERGQRFILAELQVENTGRRPFLFEPYYVYLQDTEGFLYPQTFVFRSPEDTEARPDFPSEEIPTGDTVTGVLAFSVLSDAEIVRIVYTDGQRLLFLADLTVEPLIDLDATPEAAATTDTDTDTADAEDTDAEDTDIGTLDLSEEECEDVTAWYEEAESRFAELEGVFGEALSAAEPDPDTVRDAAEQLRALAEDQDQAEVPEAAQEANDMVVESLNGFADALDEYADLIEGGMDSTEAANEAFGDILTSFDDATAAIDQLTAACGIETE